MRHLFTAYIVIDRFGLICAAWHAFRAIYRNAVNLYRVFDDVYVHPGETWLNTKISPCYQAEILWIHKCISGTSIMLSSSE
jgi:hypothetical protein